MAKTPSKNIGVIISFINLKSKFREKRKEEQKQMAFWSFEQMAKAPLKIIGVSYSFINLESKFREKRKEEQKQMAFWSF